MYFDNSTRDLLALENESQPPANENANPPSDNVSVASFAQVRLPNFWRHSPREWFFHAEAVFANHRLRSDASKANFVIAALDEEGIRSVCDLIGPGVCYESLKQRLISAFAVPQTTRFRSIVQPGGLGDRRPSQLLRDMRYILPDSIGEDALKQFWLQKLPSTTAAIISGQDGALEELAARADRVMEATSTYDVHAVNMSEPSADRFRSIENAIAALTAQVANLVTLQSNGSNHSRSRSRSKSRSNNNKNNGMCFYHDRFGASAHKCIAPCTFKSPEN